MLNNQNRCTKDLNGLISEFREIIASDHYNLSVIFTSLASLNSKELAYLNHYLELEISLKTKSPESQEEIDLRDLAKKMSNSTREKALELEELFWQEFLIQYGSKAVITPTQYSKLKYLAWEKGHSGGYEEVLNQAIDLIDLFITTPSSYYE
jgi:hypothetical protein